MNEFRIHGKLVAVALLLSLFMLAGCSRKPLTRICVDSAPLFRDDLNIESLTKAVQSNLDYLLQQPQDKPVSVDDLTFPLSRLTLSMEHFLTLLATDPSAEELDNLVKKQYDIFQAAGARGFNPGRKMLVTGYFQPVFEGRLTKKAPFLYPLYALPADLIRSNDESSNELRFSRLKNGKNVPYWSRKEIENNNRAAGHELVWLKDPFDAFVLHVQGSGLVRLQDGTMRGVHYAAKNGHPYRSIGKLMVETGRISLEEASLATIRNYIASHPEEREEILHHNPSFIFFNWTETHGAIGNLGKELTPGRSIAVDQDCFPAGGLAFLLSRKPSRLKTENVSWQPMHRFVVVQDTGSAIRGPGRVDLFWGAGSEAGFEAGQMKEKGTLFFLLLKEDNPSRIAVN